MNSAISVCTIFVSATKPINTIGSDQKSIPIISCCNIRYIAQFETIRHDPVSIIHTIFVIGIAKQLCRKSKFCHITKQFG